MNAPRIHHSFDSLAEAIQYRAEVPKNTTRVNTWAIYDFDPDAMWRRVFSPSPELVKTLEDLRAEMKNELEAVSGHAPRRRRVRGLEDGDELNIDSVLRREPACWEAVRRPQSPALTATIVAQTGALASVSFAAAKWRGVAALVLAEQLALRGVAVRVLSVWASDHCIINDKATQVYTEVLVKDFDAPLNMTSMLTACGNINFSRSVLLHSRPAILGDNPLTNGFGHTLATIPPHVMAERGWDYTVPQSLHNKATMLAWLERNLP